MRRPDAAGRARGAGNDKASRRSRAVARALRNGFVCPGAVCCLLAGIAMGAPLVVEETFLSVEIGGETYALETLVAKEPGKGARLPVAVITHGQARDPDQREKVTPRAYARTAREFARRGWLAVVVVRRGFGQSAGKQPYVLRSCRNGNYAVGLDEQTDDLEAAIKAIARRGDADPTEIIALGVSVGGAAVLNLASRQLDGLKAVINVAGGIRTSPLGDISPETCMPEDLVALYADIGRRSRLPSLWLYADNDSVFSPDYVRQLHEAYLGQGGRTEFHMFDAVGPDGHEMFGHLDGMLRWMPVLDRFFRTQTLRAFDPAPLEASLRQLNLGASARQAAMLYAGRPTEKALAISRSNGIVYTQFGGTDIEEVERLALQQCAEQAKEPCRLLVRNFDLVEEPAGQASTSSGPVKPNRDPTDPD